MITIFTFCVWQAITSTYLFYKNVSSILLFIALPKSLHHLLYLYPIKNGLSYKKCSDHPTLPKCVERAECPHHQAILVTQAGSYNWTPFWHYLPGDSMRCHKALFHFRCQLLISLRWHLWFWPASYKLEVPMTLSLAYMLMIKSYKTSHPYFQHQLQVWVITCASDQMVINQRFPRSPPYIWLIC